MKECMDIFVTFLRVGVMTFGGGYAMIPVVERELIKRKGWIPMEEVMDYYTVAQIIPGIIGVNLSAFVGFKRKGIAGGIIAPFGFILPGVTFVVILAMFISNFAEIKTVQQAFAGIRIAVGALILDTVIKLARAGLKDVKSWIIFIVVFALSAIPAGVLPLPAFTRSPVFLVLASGIVGLVVYSFGKSATKKTAPPSSSGAASAEKGSNGNKPSGEECK